jgi:hypothetical protein
VDQHDLKEVRGIGRRVEARLKEGGITDLGQLARASVTELAAILAGVSGKFDADRIVREDWLAQAADLAATSAGQVDAAETMAPIRHNFTVEVRRTPTSGQIESSRIVHVQSRDEEAWHGWHPQRLVAFIEQRSTVPTAPPERAEGQPQPVPETPTAATETGSDGTANLSLQTFAMVPASGPEISGQGPIKVTLTVDPAATRLPVNRAAEVKADVFLRQCPPSKSILVGKGSLLTRMAEPVRLEIPCELPFTSRSAAIFATVRVLVAAADAGGAPSGGLADARLEISA